MGWSLGWDNRFNRDIGYGVPAWCDHPKCDEEIDRGLSYVCGKHLTSHEFRDGDCRGVCPRCDRMRPQYKHPKPEHPTWINHKLTDPSWEEWRRDEPKEVEKLKAMLARQPIAGKAHTWISFNDAPNGAA